MFDIAFTELMIISVVALIVIGPERLPKVARTVGHLFGRMQRYVSDVKADLSREMQFEELRKLQSEMEQTARSIETSVTNEMRDAEEQVNKIARDASVELAAGPATPPDAGDTGAAGKEQLPLDLDGSAPAPAADDKPA